MSKSQIPNTRRQKQRGSRKSFSSLFIFCFSLRINKRNRKGKPSKESLSVPLNHLSATRPAPFLTRGLLWWCAYDGMAEEPRGKAGVQEPPGAGAVVVAALEAWRKGEEEAAETEGEKEEGMSVWWSIEWLPRSVGCSTNDAPFHPRPLRLLRYHTLPRALPRHFGAFDPRPSL